MACSGFCAPAPPGVTCPRNYEHWGSTYNRFRNRQKDGTWERFLDTLANDPDLEWLMIDYSYVKAHQHGDSVPF